MNLKYQFYRAYYDQMDPRIFVKDKGDNTDAHEKEVNKKNKRIEDRNEKIFKDKNKTLFDTSNYSATELANYKLYSELSNVPPVDLVTTYPGLVIGTGYTHETKNKGELKLGFHFDHTSGLPEIPGHSVKGMLRHAFPRRDQQQTTEPSAVKKAKAAFILELLDLSKEETIKKPLEWVTLLEKQIFENIDPTSDDDKSTKKSESSPDIFFPAYITKPGKGDTIIGPDTLTPHGDNPLKNPTPLPFLKVLPGVTWSFNFKLEPTEIQGVMVSAETKRNLFANILLLLGAGAKSNVGYGHFEDANKNNDKTSESPYKIPAYIFPKRDNTTNESDEENGVQETSKSESRPSERVIEAEHKPQKVNLPNVVDGVVIEGEGMNYQVDLYLEKRIERIHLKTFVNRNYQKEQVIQVSISINEDGSIKEPINDLGLKK